MAVVLQGTISALGYYERGVYHPEPDCFESLRDIVRFLRHDDKDFTARCTCGERNIVENDLVPLMCASTTNAELFDVCLRVTASLLQPTIITFQGKLPEDKEQAELYMKIEGYLSNGKAAFANSTIFKVLRMKLEKFFMETLWDQRDEDDRLVMERILLLLRFVFSIGQTFNNTEVLRRVNDVHDRVLEAYLDSEIDQVLTFIGASKVDREFHLSILEVISLTLRAYDPSAVVEAKHGRDEEAKKRAEAELRQVFEAEERKRILQRRNVALARHSRFGGTYVVKGKPSINPENDLLLMKPVKDASEIADSELRKKKKLAPRNRRVNNEITNGRAPLTHLALKINPYVERIFETSFNSLIKSNKEKAFNNSIRALSHRNSEIQFFVFLQFCLHYARLTKVSSEKVIEALGKEMFHFIQVKIVDCLELARTDKQKAKQHGMRARYALSSYKELILYHQHLIDNGTQVEKEMALETCAYILRMQEYRELGIRIFKEFSPSYLTRSFLEELILSTHYYLKILEKNCKNETLKVLKKEKKKKTRTTKTDEKAKLAKSERKKKKLLDKMTIEQLQELWEVLCVDLDGILTDFTNDEGDILPINSALQVEDDDHKKFLLLRVQRSLRSSNLVEAIALNKSGRKIFSDDEAFGKDGDLLDEVNHLKEVFFVDLKEVAEILEKAEMELEKNLNGNLVDDESGYSNEESEGEYEEVEENFEFANHLIQFARPDVIKWYIFIFNNVLTNSHELNKAIVKMLHRIAFDLNESCRIFQVSTFQVLMKVKGHLETLDKAQQKSSPLYEIYKFGHHFINSFFKLYEKMGNQLFAECLFWKSPRECYEIEHGYGSYNQDKEKPTSAWTDDLELEVRNLHSEFVDMDERPADMDVIDFIEHNLSRPRSRMQIYKKLKQLGLDALGAKTKKGTLSGFPLIPAKDAFLEWQKLDENDRGDLVDYIQKQLLEDHGEFSRPKIIKQLAYIGAAYEGKRRKNPGGQKKRTRLIGEEDSETDEKASKKSDSEDGGSEKEVSEHDESNQSVPATSLSQIQSKKRGKKRLLLIDTDDEDMDKEDLAKKEGSQDVQVTDFSQMHSRTTGKKRSILNDSDDEDVNDGLEQQELGSQNDQDIDFSQSTSRMGAKKRLLLDDSDNEDVNQKEQQEDSNQSVEVPTSSQFSSKKTGKKRYILDDSDDEDDVHQELQHEDNGQDMQDKENDENMTPPEHAAMKKRRVVLSDDSDDET